MRENPSGLVSRLLPMTPMASAALACVFIAMALPSCNRQPGQGILETQTISNLGNSGQPPVVRVLLTPSPVSGALVGTVGSYRLVADERVINDSRSSLPLAQVSRSGDTWHFNSLPFQGSTVTVDACGGRCRMGDVEYRGRLVLHAVGADQFVVVNHVDMEGYLAGVLPKELLSSWSFQTYRALAIAARTFALYQQRKTGPSRDWDLGDNQGSQMYGGMSAETEKSNRAVRDTHGTVLVYGRRGQEVLFMAQYSACNGGHVNGASVIREAPAIEPLLGGQVDEDGQECPKFRWEPVKIAKGDVLRAVQTSYPTAGNLKNANEIRVVSETGYGRALWVEVVDSFGQSVRLRAEDLRLALSRSVKAAKCLYSMNCKIRDQGDSFLFYDGRGFGHGVGLSQWGAEGKAQRGWSAEQILDFYYPGAARFGAY